MIIILVAVVINSVCKLPFKIYFLIFRSTQMFLLLFISTNDWNICAGYKNLMYYINLKNQWNRVTEELREIYMFNFLMVIFFSKLWAIVEPMSICETLITYAANHLGVHKFRCQ